MPAPVCFWVAVAQTENRKTQQLYICLSIPPSMRVRTHLFVFSPISHYFTLYSSCLPVAFSVCLCLFLLIGLDAIFDGFRLRKKRQMLHQLPPSCCRCSGQLLLRVLAAAAAGTGSCYCSSMLLLLLLLLPLRLFAAITTATGAVSAPATYER